MIKKNKLKKAAKESGDFSSLSAVDLKVLALTYQLSKEFEPDKPIKESLTAVETKTQIGADQTGTVLSLPYFHTNYKNINLTHSLKSFYIVYTSL